MSTTRYTLEELDAIAPDVEAMASALDGGGWPITGTRLRRIFATAKAGLTDAGPRSAGTPPETPTAELQAIAHGADRALEWAAKYPLGGGMDRVAAERIYALLSPHESLIRSLAERSDATPVVHSGSSSGDGERRDAERLDWLEANTYMASHGAVGMAARDQWWVVGCPARDVRWKGSTLRAAIDAAMAAAPVPPIQETGGRDAGRRPSEGGDER